MSFREKSAWISLVTTLAIWGFYFVRVAGEIAGGRPDGGELMGLFVGAVVLSIVLEVVLAIVLAAFTPKDARSPADERERLIGLKATNVAYTVLIIGVVAVALNSPFVAMADLDLFPGDPAGDMALIAANGVLAAVVLAELVRAAGQILLFRRGG